MLVLSITTLSVSVTVLLCRDNVTKATLIKKKAGGRGLAHYHYSRGHGTMQVGMVLDKKLRAISWFTESRHGERAAGPGMSF